MFAAARTTAGDGAGDGDGSIDGDRADIPEPKGGSHVPRRAGVAAMIPTTFTVLGAGGTIGSALVASLRHAGHVVHAVDRAGLAAFFTAPQPAGRAPRGRMPPGHV